MSYSASPIKQSSEVIMHSKPSRIAAAAILALACAMPAASRAVAIDRGASPPADAVAIPKGSREKAVKELPHIIDRRSEEHTSELQSLMRNSYAVFCLTKKKQT